MGGKQRNWLNEREGRIYFWDFVSTGFFRLKTNTGIGESKREGTNVEHVKKIGNWDYRDKGRIGYRYENRKQMRTNDEF